MGVPLATHLVSKGQGRLVPMVAVGNQKALFRHFTLNGFDRPTSGYGPYHVLNFMFVGYGNSRRISSHSIEQRVNSLLRIRVHQEDLTEVGSRMP
jgi:hypothetical protein